MTFPGVEGISFYIPEFRYGEEKYDSFVSVIGSDEISDVNNNFNVSDTSESREIAGTIYVVQELGKEYIYYMNPVYQTADGEIVVLSRPIRTGLIYFTALSYIFRGMTLLSLLIPVKHSHKQTFRSNYFRTRISLVILASSCFILILIIVTIIILLDF